VTITASNPRWAIDEDYALKEKLSGFTLINYADGSIKKIPVYFRFPDPEERERAFPHIAIDLVEINFDPARAHRSAGFNLPYDLEQATPLFDFGLVADDYPLPWSLVYQISAYSRQPWQDRQLSLMLYQMFPEQYGSLDMSAFDGTVRRADLVSVVRRDTVDNNQKRVYRQIFTVAVSSEFFLNQIVTVQLARSIDITVIPYVGEVPQ
jgi:hypothetical protein